MHDFATYKQRKITNLAVFQCNCTNFISIEVLIYLASLF